MLKYVLRICVYSLIILITVYSCMLYINARRYPDSPPSAFGIYTMRILTGSMEPAIGVNDYILIREADIEEIEVGDIITFYNNENKEFIVTHRVRDKVESDQTTKLITQGDANNRQDDEYVTVHTLIGKQFLVIPGIDRWINTIPVHIIIPVICLGLGLYMLLKDSKKINKHKEKVEIR